MSKTQVRCAIYTRKSTDDGLSQEFNSLDAQRESAEAYIASQKGEGWTCSGERYDDGGFTGGNIERPALKRLMADIEAGRIDCVVVYKVDRLSRSLMDFARLMELFDRKGVSFVSVTQQFNTTQSMGRLTLNILLSFAQFEREIISERTRDKIAAARRKGMWSGGRWVLGYDVDPVTRRLVVVNAEAALVRSIFDRYLSVGSLLEVARWLNESGSRTKLVTTAAGRSYGGRAWDKVAVFKVLRNVLYAGLVRHKRETYAGQHEAIVDQETWRRAQEMLSKHGKAGGTLARNKYGALLKGLVRCKPCDAAMVHTCAVKGDRAWRYYVCHKAQKQGWDKCPCGSLPAEQIERFVLGQIRKLGTDPELRSTTLAALRERAQVLESEAAGELEAAEAELKRASRELAKAAGEAGKNAKAAGRLADLHEAVASADERAALARRRVEDARATAVTKADLDAALDAFDGLWESMTPTERAELVRLVVARVDYDATKGSVSITFHPMGLRGLARGNGKERAA